MQTEDLLTRTKSCGKQELCRGCEFESRAHSGIKCANAERVNYPAPAPGRGDFHQIRRALECMSFCSRCANQVIQWNPLCINRCMVHFWVQVLWSLVSILSLKLLGVSKSKLKWHKYTDKCTKYYRIAIYMCISCYVYDNIFSDIKRCSTCPKCIYYYI